MRKHHTTAADPLPPPSGHELDTLPVEALPAVLGGFDAGPDVLPGERTDVPLFRRERAAALVLAIGRLHTPEECISGAAAKAEALLNDPLERREAMTYVDLLLDALTPRAAVAS